MKKDKAHAEGVKALLAKGGRDPEPRVSPELPKALGVMLVMTKRSPKPDHIGARLVVETITDQPVLCVKGFSPILVRGAEAGTPDIVIHDGMQFTLAGPHVERADYRIQAVTGEIEIPVIPNQITYRDETELEGGGNLPPMVMTFNPFPEEGDLKAQAYEAWTTQGRILAAAGDALNASEDGELPGNLGSNLLRNSGLTEVSGFTFHRGEVIIASVNRKVTGCKVYIMNPEDFLAAYQNGQAHEARCAIMREKVREAEATAKAIISAEMEIKMLEAKINEKKKTLADRHAALKVLAEAQYIEVPSLEKLMEDALRSVINTRDDLRAAALKRAKEEEEQPLEEGPTFNSQEPSDDEAATAPEAIIPEPTEEVEIPGVLAGEAIAELIENI